MTIINPIRIGDTGQEFKNKINANFDDLLAMLVPATEESLGFVKIGDNLQIDLDGLLTALPGLLSSTEELNILQGLLATTEELNILKGLLASTEELNTLEGLLATTEELNKLSGLVTTTEELNILQGLLSSTEELNYLQGASGNIQEQLDLINSKEIKRTVVFYFQSFFSEEKKISLYVPYKGALETMEILLPKILTEDLTGELIIGELTIPFVAPQGESFLTIPVEGLINNEPCSLKLLSGEELEGVGINLNFIEKK